MTTLPVLVTGATGNVGGAVARSLLAAGIPIRVAGTDEIALRARFPGAETVCVNFYRPETFGPALTGVSGLFLLRPPPISRVGPTLNAMVDVAARQGVEHVVFSSVTGADTNWIVPHHRVETHLRTAGVPWTILRPGFFAQNLADAYRDDINDDDRIYLPAGRGRAAFIDTRDVGDVAAVIFAEPRGHRGAGYTLTGAQALDFAEVAALLTESLGRRIRYEAANITGYLWHLHRRRLPLIPAVVQTALHAGLRHGQAQQVDSAVARLLGRAPRTLDRYIEDHRAVWSKPRPAR